LFGKRIKAEDFGRELGEDFFKFLSSVWDLLQDATGSLPPETQYESLAFAYFTFDVALQNGDNEGLRGRILDGLIMEVFSQFPDLPESVKKLVFKRCVEYARVLETCKEQRSMLPLSIAFTDTIVPGREISMETQMLLFKMFDGMYKALQGFVRQNINRLK
jgi:hypothetical protein